MLKISFIGSSPFLSVVSNLTLSPETDYYITIDGSAFTDNAGNSFVGIEDKETLSFSTAQVNTSVDNIKPTLQETYPALDSVDIPLDSNIILNFSEIVNFEKGNIFIKKEWGNSLVEIIDISGNQVTRTGPTQITINPSSDLEAGTEYYIKIDPTAFDDTSGNSFEGINDEKTFSFTSVGNVSNKENKIEPLEVINQVKFSELEADIFYFNDDLNNVKNIKSVTISKKDGDNWIDIVKKDYDDIYQGSDILPSSISWPYQTVNFSDNLRIQSLYEDDLGEFYISNSFWEIPEDWESNKKYLVTSVEISKQEDLSYHLFGVFQKISSIVRLFEY